MSIELVGPLIVLIICLILFGRPIFLLVFVFAISVALGWTTRPEVPILGTQLSFGQFQGAISDRSSIYSSHARHIADHMMLFVSYGFLVGLVVAIIDGISTRSRRKKKAM